MTVERPFDAEAVTADRVERLAGAVGGLRSGRVERGRPVGAGALPARDALGGGPVPLLAPLAGLLPQGLRRGDVAVVATRDGTPDYLSLALLAGALAAGLWCAAVGVAGLGGLAVPELVGHREQALRRLLVVPAPGERWVRVVEALADGVDLVLLRPPGAVPAGLRRRIEARLRQSRAEGASHRAVLLVLGDWPGAVVRLRTEATVWTGLSGSGPRAGTGHLTGGKATVSAVGRATAGRGRVARLWLPDRDGAARSLADDPARGGPASAVA